MRSRKSLLGKALNGYSSQRKPLGKAGFENASSLLPLRSYSAELQSTCVLFKRLLLKWQQFLMITPWTMFPQTSTPAYLLNGQQIMSVPHPLVESDQVSDLTYQTNKDFLRKAKRDTLLIQHFRQCWCHEYLPSLQEFHKSSGINMVSVKVGDVVLIQDDNPKVQCKLEISTCHIH